jgi:hypothetical protein
MLKAFLNVVNVMAKVLFLYFGQLIVCLSLTAYTVAALPPTSSCEKYNLILFHISRMC